MKIADAIARFTIRPDIRDLPVIREQLANLTAAEKNRQGNADTDLMRLYTVQLFSAGDSADIELIWKAKTASMDADASIDVQLLCGCGLEASRSYLSKTPFFGASAALIRIQECEAAGDFAEFSIEQVLCDCEEYYGLN